MLDPDQSLLKRSCSEEISEVQGYQEILYRDVSYGGPVKRSCIESSCIEMSHMGVLSRDLVESSCLEISHRGLVKRSCGELLYRDLS